MSAKPPRGSAVLYSAAPESLTDDARDNMFVAELITQMQAPHSTLDEAFGRTSAAVARASGGTQTPWFASSLGERFSFGPKLPEPESSASGALPKAAQDDKKITRTDEAAELAKVAGGSEIRVASADPQQDQTRAESPARVGVDPGDATMIKNLDAKLQSNPRDALSLYTRGQLFAKNADFYRAATDFDAAIRLNPRDAAAFSNRCLARAMFLDLQVALEDCNQALRLRPNYPDALESRGLVHLKMGLASEAIADYDAALRIRPNRAAALYGRGLGKVRLGRTAEGNSDIAAAKGLNTRVGEEFAGYGL
jgi:tetratricopeptide (TPR) repeat protein